MTVYIDILLLINFYTDYLIIKFTLAIIKRNVKPIRILIASFAASLTSLAVFLPENIVTELIFKFLTAVIISLILRGIEDIVKTTAVLVVTAAAFNGIFVIVSKTFFNNRLISVNGYSYFDISLLTFGLITTVTYFILKAVSRFFTLHSEKKFKIKIYSNGKCYEFMGISDSGNKLTDYLTGKPVIICPSNSAFSQMNVMRILPYNTINSDGIVRIVKTDKIEISFENDKTVNPDALIGINEYSTASGAIVNPSLLI